MLTSLLGSLFKSGIALAVILLSLLYLYNEGQHWKDKYTALVASSASAVSKQEQKIKLERTAALKESTAEHKRYLEQLAAMLGVTEQLGDKNATLKTVMAAIITERTKLRNAIASSNNSGVPERSSSISDTAARGSDCDATAVVVKELTAIVTNLRKACAVTTTDYNQLRKEFNRNCELTGCVPNIQQELIQ